MVVVAAAAAAAAVVVVVVVMGFHGYMLRVVIRLVRSFKL